MHVISRPRLRTILLGVNLVVLIVPVLGIAFLRIYETELIRRTEAELIAQAAFIKATAEHHFTAILASENHLLLPEGYGKRGEVNWPRNIDDQLRPIEPVLSTSSHPVLASEPDPAPPKGNLDPMMQELGRRLEPLFLDAQKITLSGMNLVDWRSNTVASTSESQRGRALLGRDEIDGALHQGQVMRVLRERAVIPEATSLQSLSRETSVRVFISIPIVVDGHIIGAATVWRTPQSLPKALYENRLIFTALVAFMLLTGLAMAALTSFYISRPIQRLIAQTEQVTRNDDEGQRPIDNPGTFELQQLSESIATMATTLEERANYIRTFATNVSHEFKTPLTSIRGAVELLQDHLQEMTDEERDRFLTLVEAETNRLDALVRRLLELARADVSPKSSVLIDPVHLIEEIADAHRREDFTVTINLSHRPDDGSPPLVAISEEALASALSNLLVNARQHGATQVEIALSRPDEATLAIDVQDNGPGISCGNAPRVFDEFFTTARDDGGTGLGLSITRALLLAHQGTIALVDGPHEGARFRIELTTAQASKNASKDARNKQSDRRA